LIDVLIKEEVIVVVELFKDEVVVVIDGWEKVRSSGGVATYRS